MQVELSPILFIPRREQVPFDSCKFPRNATDKTDLAQFPTSSSAVGLGDPREGAPRILGRQKVPRDLRLRKYPLIFGPSKFAAQAQFNTGAQGQNQGLAWSSDSSLWGNQVQKVKNHKFWTEPRPCMVLGLKPMGKPSINF